MDRIDLPAAGGQTGQAGLWLGFEKNGEIIWCSFLALRVADYGQHLNECSSFESLLDLIKQLRTEQGFFCLTLRPFGAILNMGYLQIY